MDGNQVLIDIKGLSFSYNKQREVISSLDLQVKKGEKLGLVGPNGSGKTTLLHLIMGLLKADSGSISLFGKEIQGEKEMRWARRKMGLLFQDPDDQLFCPTVLEDVAFGPLNLGLSKEMARKKAKETLRLLGLEGFENRIISELSGGEKKLVSLATVLSMDPEVLLLDEPTNGLDLDSYERIVNILNSLHLTCLYVSHDLDFLLNTTTKIYVMEKGRLRVSKDLVPHPHVHVHELGDIHHVHRRIYERNGPK